MNICIGGDLEGQKVDKDVYSFMASEIDETKSSEYFTQSYILKDKTYKFWINVDMDFHDASNIVEKMLRGRLS